jgi:hypothetical protein
MPLLNMTAGCMLLSQVSNVSCSVENKVRSENEASGTHGAQTRGDEQLMVLQMTVR